MRGKEAAKAANQRHLAALEEIEQLKADLKAERDRQSQLKDEIQRRKTEHFQEAARIAGEEVKRQLARVEKERRDRGLSDDIVNHMTFRKDMLIRNACRYVSMTKGVDPTEALMMVMTWAYEKDFTEGKGLGRMDFLIELGVPFDGWVARTCKRIAKFKMPNIWRASAISLDKAQAEGHPDIHPKYKKEWYPAIDYGGIVVTGLDDEEDAPSISDLLVAERDGVI